MSHAKYIEQHGCFKIDRTSLEEDEKGQGNLPQAQSLEMWKQFFMLRVITGEETWVYGYDPKTKQQSLQWKRQRSPRPKKV